MGLRCARYELRIIMGFADLAASSAIIIQTPNKFVDKQGESVMLDVLQIVVIYASRRWRQVGTPCIFHSR